MSYQLILSEYDPEAAKDVGENVFLDDLPQEYKVYMLYYPGAGRDIALENKLRSFGEITGTNLFVNISGLDDPKYDLISSKFDINNLPVIIVTAIDTLASTEGSYQTAYVKIESKSLLNSPERLLECLQKLFQLFIQGKISEAMGQYKKEKMSVIVARIKDMMKNAIVGIFKFIDERDISVSWIEGKLELKRSG